MVERIKRWWKSLALTIKSTLITAIVSIVLGALSFMNSCEAISLAKKEFLTKNTPDLRAYIRSSNIYVGEGTNFGRIDNVIGIPLVIINKGYGLAKEIKLTVIYNDGGGSDKEASQIIPILEGGKPAILPEYLQSILNNARDVYSAENKTFKMKVLLGWEDICRNKYESAELFKLGTTESYADYPSRFIFISQGFYNSIDNLKELKKHSEHKIDF